MQRGKRMIKTRSSHAKGRNLRPAVLLGVRTIILHAASVACLFMCIMPRTAACGQMANIEFVHSYIQQKHGITVPTSEPNINKAVNVRYVLCTVDVANRILNGGATTDYCNHALAAETTVNGVAVNPAADTVTVINAVDGLICAEIAALQEDYNNGIYTWNGKEWCRLPNTYNGESVTHYGITSYDAALKGKLDGRAAIYPTYYVQSMCSDTPRLYAQPGNPAYAPTGINCWCRLKRRSDNANAASWVSHYDFTSAAHCDKSCPVSCAAYTGG
jgi:hypothetical protein